MLTKPTARASSWLLIGGLAAAGLTAWSTTLSEAAARSRTPQNALREAQFRLPLAFERNQGQAEEEVRYLARTSGATLLVGDTGASLKLQSSARRKGETLPAKTRRPRRLNPLQPAGPAATVTMRFVDARPEPTIAAERPLPGKVNYLFGSDRSRWKTNVPTFGAVRCAGIYDGVDVTYYGNGSQLEYDLVVQPGADPAAIQVDLQGADRLRLEPTGDLLIETAAGPVRQHKPVAYQEIEGARQPVPARYALNDHRLAFELGEYDRSRPLVIDPVINYGRLLGGGGNEVGAGVGVDGSGNAYFAGTTTSVNFPTTAGAEQDASAGGADVFVSKISADGTALLYSTYVGGSGTDSAQGIAVDSAGNATVVGDTSSTNFPNTGGQVSNAGNGDAFVFRLNASGVGQFYTYLGGSDSDIANGVALDGSGNAYVVGWTASASLPAAVNSLVGQADAFVAKLNTATTTFAYSRYIGGRDFDVGFGIAVDPGTNEAVIVGDTFSNDFPVSGAFRPNFGGVADGFVTRVNSSGTALAFSTYFGGADFDSARAVALDGTNNVYVTGTTYSDALSVNGEGFPIASAFQAALNGSADAYVARLNAAGNSLVYSTYLGGSVAEGGFAIDVDTSGNAWVAGETESGDFPTVAPAQAYFGGGTGANPTDAFVAQVHASGQSLVFSSYLGGEGNETALGVTATASDIAYLTGVTASSEFPITTGGGSLQGPTDAFALRLGPNSGSGVPLTPTNLQGTASLTSISLSWTDNSTNETHFELERRTGGQDFSLLVATTASFYVDNDVVPLETYVYRVRAVNGTGASPYSNQLSVTVPTTKPDKPTGLIAVVVNEGQIDLQWTDNADNEDAYKVERKDGDGEFLLVDLLLPDSEAYSDITVAAGVVYTYRVIASNAMGDSDPALVGPINGYSGGKLKVSPSKAKFPKVKAGPVPIGKKKKKKITIKNLAKTELRGTVVTPVEPFFILSGGGAFTLPPKKSLKVIIEFAPEEADRYNETLVITSTDPKKPTVNVPLIGVGK